MTPPSHSLPVLCADSGEISPPPGHYSHVCVAGGLVHISGQLPVSPDDVPLANHPFGDQVRQVLANVEACLRKAGVGSGLARWIMLRMIKMIVAPLEHLRGDGRQRDQAHVLNSFI